LPIRNTETQLKMQSPLFETYGEGSPSRLKE